MARIIQTVWDHLIGWALAHPIVLCARQGALTARVVAVERPKKSWWRATRNAPPKISTAAEIESRDSRPFP